MQSTILLGAALLGSLLQHAAAAPEANSKRADIQFPQCISTCMRNSGCFDSECICKKADDGILSDIVICMNQWCPADVTAKDLIEPLEGQCDFSKSAVQDAEKKGGVAVDAGDDEDESSSKPMTTSSSGKSGDDEVIMTFDLGKPQTNPAGPATTTATPVASGTLTVATAAATTGLLTDDSDSGVTGKLGAATSTPATPSSSAAAGEADKSSDDEGNAAGLTRQASVFGAVAAMGFALALGF
jgi:hypothetical protein